MEDVVLALVLPWVLLLFLLEGIIIDDDIQSDGEDAHEDILINDVIDDVDYPSGSDSAAFVDRMDLADAYDEGIWSLGIIARCSEH